MPYLPKPKNNGKRTSLVPTWINKKNKSKSNEQLKLEDNVLEVNEEKSNNLNTQYSKYDNNSINNSQPYEKITYKNTTTKSIERVTSDGEYNKAVETNEQVEERIKYGNIKNSFDNHLDNVIDLQPVEEIELTPLEPVEVKPKKLLQNNMISSNYSGYLKQVRQNGLYLKNIDNQTKELCLEAVKQNGLALQYAKFQNDFICLTAINENILAFKYIKNKTHMINLKAVQIDGLLIKEIDESNQTEDIKLASVRQNGFSLKYIRNQTPRICIEAVKQNPLAFNYVKDKTDDICEEVVKQNGLALQFIKNQNTKICTNAIRQNPYSLEYVINQTDELCEEALLKSGLALQYVRNKTKNLCLLALQQSSQAIRFIPSSLLSDSLDLSDYVFIYINSKAIVPSIPELKGLKRINLPINDTGFNIMNTLKYNNIPTNFVVQKEGYVDDDFVDDLKLHNHCVVVLEQKKIL